MLESMHKALPAINAKSTNRQESIDYNIIIYQKIAYNLLIPLFTHPSDIIANYV